jgi:hypothetical protein
LAEERVVAFVGQDFYEAMRAGLPQVEPPVKADPAPRMKLSPASITVRRDGRWIAVEVRFTKPARSWEVKLRRYWANFLYEQLGKVLVK